MIKKGLLISLEGGEGCGKSTQAIRMKAFLEENGYAVRIVQEPGETQIGKKIRSLLLSKEHTEMAPLAEVLLYMAARAQLVEEIIQPALKHNSRYAIICDRYMDSSMAYQGYARKLGLETVHQMNMAAVKGFIPDITFFFDLKPEEGLARKNKSSHGKMDRLESESLLFHRKVRKGYQILAKQTPKRIKTIHAQKLPDEVWQEIEGYLQKIINQ
jgi:dTMP kinase